MAEEEDTPPPPPPSSPLPTAEAFEDLQENESPPRGSKNFASLQKMFSSSKTMYSDPGHSPLQRSGLHSHPGDLDPPTKRPRASVDEELLAGESPKLTHQTRNRPKRKVRVPSKSMLKAMKSQSSGVVDVSIDEGSTVYDESADADVFPTDMPPPPPDSAPPMVPSDPPPSFASSGPPESHLDVQLAQVVENPSRHSNAVVDITGASQGNNDEGGTPSLKPTANTTLPSLSLSQAPAKQLSSNSDIDKNEDITTAVKLASAGTAATASMPPATSGAIRSQAVVIGSFSERLRRIREKHTTGASSTLSPPKDPPVMSTDASDSFMFSAHGDTLSSPKPATASPIQSPPLASPLFTSSLPTPSQTSMPPAAIDAPRVFQDSNPATTVFPISPNSTPLDFNLKSFNATGKKNKGKMAPDLSFPLPDDIKSRENDSFPLEPLAEESGEESMPPPLPPSPPPKSPQISRSSPVVSDNILPPSADAYQSQSSSYSKREGWKKKRQELDSLMSEPLPLLIHTSKVSEAPTETKATVVMEAGGTIPENRNTTATIFEAPDNFEAPMDDSSFKSSSSTSLPSLPDSPPPELPTSPPPELPTSPPPNLMDIATDSGELVIMEPTLDLGIPSLPPVDSDDMEKERVFGSNQTSLPGPNSGPPRQEATTGASDTTTVKLRHHQPNQSERRISAFDALVATEPDVEERREPKLSISDRRSLALKAAKRPDADTQQLLQRWSVHMNESAGTQPLSGSKTEMSPNKPDSMETRDGRGSELKTSTPTDALDSTSPSQNSGSLPSDDGPSQVLQSEIPFKNDTSASSIRNRSYSEVGAAHRIRKHPARFRQSVPLSPDDLQKVKVISEGEVMPSPDIKYTRVTKRRWRKQQQEQRVFDDLSSSASTGNIIHSATFPESEIQETTSLRSFGSSSESLKFEDTRRPEPGSHLSPLVLSQMKKESSEASEELARSDKELDESTDAIMERKQTDDPGLKRQSSGLLDSVLTDVASKQSSGAQSFSSSKEDLLRENNAPIVEEVVMESTGILEATPPPPAHPPPSSTGDAPMRAKVGAGGKKRKLRSVNSMINEASIHRKVLEEQLQGPVSDELASLGRLQHEQGQLLEQQLAQIRKQQKMTHDLLGGNQSPWDSPRALHPPSMYLDRDSLESDPEKWSVEEVCQWLELVGLGMYRQAFRERDVNGATLLRMDVQLFVELGIDSPEIREIFLARIYELSNPAADEGDVEDDFPLSVASYTSDDLKKLQAAVNALKSPVLGDSIELEPSAIGQFLLKDHVRSQSTPNIAELDLESGTPLEGPNGHSGIVPSPTVHSFPHYAVISASENYTPKGHTSINTSNGMPMAVMRAQMRTRERSYTTPTALAVMATQSTDEDGMEQKEKPLTVSKLDEGDMGDSQARTRKVEKLESTRDQPHVPKPDTSVLQLAKDLSEGSITFEGGQFRTTKQGDRSLVSMTPGFWEQPPTGQETGIVRLFMNTVQKGALYKAFLVTSSTTAELLIRQALDKANMVEDPHNYRIHQAAVAPNASSHILLPQECPLTLQTQWPSYNSHRFELRMGDNVRRLKIAVELPGRKREELLVAIATTTTCPEVIQLLLSKIHLLEEWEGKEGMKCAMVEVDPATKAERVLGDEECPAAVQSSWKELRKLKLISLSDTLKRHGTEADTKLSSIQKEVDTDSPALLARIRMLEQENLHLQQQLDSARLNLQQHQELEHKMSSLHDAHLSLLNELQRQEKSHQLKVHTLQQKVDELTLSNRKLEDKLHISTSGEKGEGNQSNLLDEIQAKYSQEVSELTGKLREKERVLQELRTKRSAMEEEISVLQSRSTELDKLSRQMGERNQQIRVFERDLTTKEDTIHRLRARLEEIQVTNDQVIALEKSLKAVETTSQQQQDFARRTIYELREEVAHLTREASQKEELLHSLGKERERATRDQQAKDVLISSLESSLERYKVLGNPAANEETKIQVLERSLGAHERALGLLRGEYQRECAELREAEEEIEKLRAVIANKDEQLSHPSTSQVTERPSLYPLVASGHPQLLVAAQVDPSEHGLGLKVTNASSKVGGCVVKEVGDFCSAKQQLNPGDRLLEINGCDVSSKTHQEVGEFLQRCHGVVKLVVGRLQPPFGAIGGSLNDLYGVESPKGMVIERFKKLNASLNAQLDSRSAEVEQWRQESERLKAEVSRHSTAQKDKDSELKYLQSTVQDLKQQLRESERSRAQLRHTLEEVESSRQDEQHSEALEARLREKTREVAMLRATEKERLSQLKKLQMKRDGAVKMLRQHLVTSDTSELPEEEVELQSKVLAHAPQSEVLASLSDIEEELQRHKNYLDQLLSIVIDSNPELLAKMGEAQKTRDQLELDNWC